MTNPEISARLTAFLRDEVLRGDPENELNESTPLLAWGILNSLNTVRLLAFIREEFQVLVPAAEVNANNLADVRAIAAMVSVLTNG